jgi:16S rRNA (guanine966-N2)-methyltransferase
VARALAAPPRAPYDIAFLDPPYADPDEDVLGALHALRDHDWLARRALVVVERSTRGPDLVWPEGFEGDRRRSYGETVLWYGLATA